MLLLSPLALRAPLPQDQSTDPLSPRGTTPGQISPPEVSISSHNSLSFCLFVSLFVYLCYISSHLILFYFIYLSSTNYFLFFLPFSLHLWTISIERSTTFAPLFSFFFLSIYLSASLYLYQSLRDTLSFSVILSYLLSFFTKMCFSLFFLSFKSHNAHHSHYIQLS